MHLGDLGKRVRAQGAVSVHPKGRSDSRGYELRRRLLGPGIGMVVEVLDVFWLRLEFARVAVAVLYTGVLALVVELLLVGSIQAVRI